MHIFLVRALQHIFERSALRITHAGYLKLHIVYDTFMLQTKILASIVCIATKLLGEFS